MRAVLVSASGLRRRAASLVTSLPVAWLLASCSPASPQVSTPPAPLTASVAAGEVPPPAPAGPTGSAVASSAPAGWTSMGAPGDKGTFEKALESWRTASQCTDYDYFPDGGIQNFWCHRPETLTLEKVRSLAGVDVFVSGPHTATSLKLDAKAQFGHYNPAFVQWLVDHASPPARDSALRRMTQPNYDEALRPLARVFWQTLRKIEADDACFQRERSLYSKQVAARTLPAQYQERWYFYMNPEFCPRAARGLLRPNDTYFYDHGMDGGVDGNVTKTVFGFWIRRSLDGTMPTFVAGLRKLIDAYDPAMLTVALPAAPPPAFGTTPGSRPSPVKRNPFDVNVF